MELSKLAERAEKKINISEFTGSDDYVMIHPLPLKSRDDIKRELSKGIDKERIQTYILDNEIKEWNIEEAMKMMKYPDHKEYYQSLENRDMTEYKIKLVSYCIDSKNHSFTDVKNLDMKIIEKLSNILPDLIEYLAIECDKFDKEYRLGEKTASI